MTQPGAFGADSVDEFAYDFDAWLEVKRGKVIIPEPSTQMVSDFFEQWAIDTIKVGAYELEEQPKKDDGTLVDETDEEQDERVMRNLNVQHQANERVKELHIRLLSDVCRGTKVEPGEGTTPSIADLHELPHRVRRQFTGYVLGKLNPQA